MPVDRHVVAGPVRARVDVPGAGPAEDDLVRRRRSGLVGHHLVQVVRRLRRRPHRDAAHDHVPRHVHAVGRLAVLRVPVGVPAPAQPRIIQIRRHFGLDGAVDVAVAVAVRHDRVVAAQHHHRRAQRRDRVADARADLRLDVRARVGRRDVVGRHDPRRVAPAGRRGPVVRDLLEGVAQRARGDDQIIHGPAGLRFQGARFRREGRRRSRIHHQAVHQRFERAFLLRRNRPQRRREVVAHRHRHGFVQIQRSVGADVRQRVHAHRHEAIALHVLVALVGRQFRGPGLRARVAGVRGHERRARLALRTTRLGRIRNDVLRQQFPIAAR